MDKYWWCSCGLSNSRGMLSLNGPGGRCGASSVCAAGRSLSSMHTAYRWERKKPPHWATTAYTNRKGLFTTFRVLRSLSTPGYLHSNLEALRRQQRPKLFLVCHYQAWEGDAQSPSEEVQACRIHDLHDCITPSLRGSPTGSCGGTAVPCEQGQVNGKA